MRGSYVGWGPQGEPSVEDGAPGDKEGVPSEAARQGRGYQEDWEGLLHHVEGTAWC